MARATPIYDRACELLAELDQVREHAVAGPAANDPRVRALEAETIAYCSLAVAESLRGVVYVANANAV